MPKQHVREAQVVVSYTNPSSPHQASLGLSHLGPGRTIYPKPNTHKFSVSQTSHTYCDAKNLTKATTQKKKLKHL